MSRRDVTDVMVVRACLDAHRSGAFASDLLTDRTGECMKVVMAAMERAGGRGLTDYGVSLRSSFATGNGLELLRVFDCGPRGLGGPACNKTSPQRCIYCDSMFESEEWRAWNR